jgi:hypothetical protein
MDPSSSATRGSGAALQASTKHKERIVRIEVNSNDRDFRAYPNPANFQWVSPFPLKNITSMTLVGGTIPVPLYTIDEPYNSFTFDTGTQKKTITLPPGMYTPVNFETELKNALDTADGTNTYTVSVHPITQRLSVQTDGANVFGFLFGQDPENNFQHVFNPALQTMRNPSYILGFLNQSVYSVSGVLTAPNAINLSILQRIYLYLNYDTTIDLRSVQLGGGRENPSAILYTSDATCTYTKTLNYDVYENVITPGLIIPRIRSIQVTLRDEFGTILNTNNRPVALLFEVCVLD